MPTHRPRSILTLSLSATGAGRLEPIPDVSGLTPPLGVGQPYLPADTAHSSEAQSPTAGLHPPSPMMRLALFVPGFALLRALAAYDNNERTPWLGIAVGTAVGLFFALVFGGALLRKWADVNWPPALGRENATALSPRFFLPYISCTQGVEFLHRDRRACNPAGPPQSRASSSLRVGAGASRQRMRP